MAMGLLCVGLAYESGLLVLTQLLRELDVGLHIAV